VRRACRICSRPAISGASRCADHIGKGGWSRYIAKYPDRAAFYRSGGWRAARERQLRMEPTCRICGRKATHVDHIVPMAEGGDPFGALQSLCEEHHRTKTTAEGHRGMKRKANR
jgi:5-methylcytosine-specific restriction endonuclease McrA